MQTTVPGGHHQFMREPIVAETAFVVEQFCRVLSGKRAWAAERPQSRDQAGAVAATHV